MQKPTRVFLYSAGTLLLITGLAKIASAFGSAQLLYILDPLTRIQFRYLLLTVGIIETGVAAVVFFTRQTELKTILIAVLATNFTLYRLGLYLMHYHKPCPCLGGLTDAIGIPSGVADTTMKCVLAYLLIGGYMILLSQWLRRGKTSDGASMIGPTSETVSRT